MARLAARKPDESGWTGVWITVRASTCRRQPGSPGLKNVSRGVYAPIDHFKIDLIVSDGLVVDFFAFWDEFRSPFLENFEKDIEEGAILATVEWFPCKRRYVFARP